MSITARVAAATLPLLLVAGAATALEAPSGVAQASVAARFHAHAQVELGAAEAAYQSANTILNSASSASASATVKAKAFLRTSADDLLGAATSMKAAANADEHMVASDIQSFDDQSASLAARVSVDIKAYAHADMQGALSDLTSVIADIRGTESMVAATAWTDIDGLLGQVEGNLVSSTSAKVAVKVVGHASASAHAPVASASGDASGKVVAKASVGSRASSDPAPTEPPAPPTTEPPTTQPAPPTTEAPAPTPPANDPDQQPAPAPEGNGGISVSLLVNLAAALNAIV